MKSRLIYGSLNRDKATLQMSLDLSGSNAIVTANAVSIHVTMNHPLIKLAAYILQKVYDLTDRQVEYGLNDNAAYQLFSGKGIVAGKGCGIDREVCLNFLQSNISAKSGQPTAHEAREWPPTRHRNSTSMSL